MLKGTLGAPRRSGASPGRQFVVPKALFWGPPTSFGGNFDKFAAILGTMCVCLFWGPPTSFGGNFDKFAAILGTMCVCVCVCECVCVFVCV